MRALDIVKTALCLALFAGVSAAAVKNVAVVEAEVDAQSGVTEKLNKAEVREITAEIRRQAVKNLPRGKFNIMTSETVMSQGSAKLEECADENCVISLGAKIGADYIVRGLISKFQTKITLTVEIYETEDGNLVASSDAVRSENAGDLLEYSKNACAEMYKQFIESLDAGASSAAQGPVRVNIAPTVEGGRGSKYALAILIDPADGGTIVFSPNKSAYYAGEKVSVWATANPGYSFGGWTGAASGFALRTQVVMNGDRSLTAHFTKAGERRTTDDASNAPVSGRKGKGGLTLAVISSGESNSDDGSALLFQIGGAAERPIWEKYLSYVVETNLWIGSYKSSKWEAQYHLVSDDIDNNYSYGYGYYGGGTLPTDAEVEDHRSRVVFGFNIPALLLVDIGMISLETGLQYDMLFNGYANAVFNVGCVMGAGVLFGKNHNTNLFIRWNFGSAFNSMTIGMRQFF